MGLATHINNKCSRTTSREVEVIRLFEEMWESCGPIIDLNKPSPKITVKPAYKGTVRNRMFSLAGRFLLIQIKKKGKGLPQEAEVAQRVPGRLRLRIFLIFGTTRVVGRQPYARAAFTPGEIPGTHL